MRERHTAPGFYVLTLLHVGCFALFYAALWQAQLAAFGGPARVLWWLKALLEILASLYFFSAVLKSLRYLLSPAGARRHGGSRGGREQRDGQADPEEPGEPGAPRRTFPPVACVYLCAGDLDSRALESLCRIEYPGRFHVFVHDDSGDERTAERVDDLTRDLACRTSRPIFLLRRRLRAGGKPGAVNYVLSCLGNRYPLVLLADNDSTAVDPRVLLKALPLLEDPRVAAVQFRNVGVGAPEERPINRILRRAIEVFDLFATHQSRHGMALFLGHNALLRTAALDDAGGLREGIFADDVDLSIRLVRRGWRILYASEIPFGETHPVSYASFRRRAYKWAFGCGQVLREHLLPVLFDRRLSFSQKAGLLEFTGFYAIQAVLILYLALVGLVLPVVSGPLPGQPLGLLLSGAAIVLSI
ncbi:MAG: glycosyltransferase, partial [Candidatus Rokubacteria bacterium]|nr:glycosyltransferase [Candidatus Rokubacteria bacterium]